jgi:hypothetical protein
MRSTTSRDLATRGLLFAAALGATPVAMAAGNGCPSILPADAIAIGAPRLCRAGAADGGELSVCREYSDERNVYQVVFRGGPSPKAVYERAVAVARPDANAAQTTRHVVGEQRCDLEPPPGVPAGATHLGTGVCEDENGRALPCSLFEHAGAREPEAMRYFVYYEPDGDGVRRVDVLSAGRNEHVLEAELAFQLGQALASASCCGDQARAYLAHAAALFPDDGMYRAALTVQLGGRTATQNTPMAEFSRMLEQSR